MPDLQNFTVTAAGAGKYHIAYQICDSKTGAVLVDRTATPLIFPDQFTGASVTAQLALVAKWAMDVIQSVDGAHWS